MSSQTYDTSVVDMVGLDSYDGGTYAYGEQAVNSSSVLVGRYISDIQCWANKSSTTSGNFKAVLRDSSDALIHTFWTMLADDLPSTATWTDNTSTASTHEFVSGDYFAFEADTASSKAQVGRNNAGTPPNQGTVEQMDATNSTGCFYKYSPFLGINVRDVWFKMTYSTSPPVTSSVTYLPPPPAMVRL